MLFIVIQTYMTIFYLMGILFFLGIVIAVLFAVNQPDPFEQVKKLMSANHIDEAIELLTREIHKDYQNSKAYFYLAEAYEKMGDCEKALDNLLEVKTLSKYSKEVPIKSVFKKIAECYNKLEQIDNAFEGYLTLLSIEPEDIFANSFIGFLLLGNEKFKESIPFLEKCTKDEEMRKPTLRALSVAYYEIEDYEKAYNRIKEIEIEDPYDDDISMIFSIISHKIAHDECKEKLELLIPITTDENKILIFVRIYTYVIFSLSSYEDGIKQLETLVKNPSFSVDTKDEIYYYLLMLVLKTENYQRTQEILESFNKSKFDIEDFEFFLNSMDIKINTNTDHTFDEVVANKLNNIIPERLLFSLANLSKSDLIQFEKYFDMAYEPYRLKEQYLPITKESFFSQYLSLSLSEFSDFAEKIMELEGYEYPEQIGEPDSEEMNFIARSIGKNKKFTLFAFRRLKENVPLSEIVIENLLHLKNDKQCENLRIFSNSTPSDDAQKKITESTSTYLYSVKKMIEFFQIWKFWGQALAEKKELKEKIE